MKRKADLLMQINTRYYFSKNLIKQFNLKRNFGILNVSGSNVLKFEVGDEIVSINKLRIEGDIFQCFSETPFTKKTKEIVMHTNKTIIEQLISPDENENKEKTKEEVDVSEKESTTPKEEIKEDSSKTEKNNEEIKKEEEKDEGSSNHAWW